jgi:transcriptional regulator with XRE-family HTH domain
MPTTEDLNKLGRELRSRREALGLKSLRAFAVQIGVSHQHLSQLERGYVNPKQGIVIPSDEVLEKLASGLGVPLSRFHVLLGRFPSAPYPAYDNPEAVDLAERYIRLPGYAQEMVQGVFGIVEAMIAAQAKVGEQ